MKKNDKLHIPCTSEQKVTIKKKADKVGMSISQYCLFILLRAEPTVKNI